MTKIGDEVYAKDEITGELGIKKVLELSVQEVNVIYNLTMGDEVFGVTAEHPFWVYGKGFKNVEDLELGDEIVTQGEVNNDDFNLVQITKIEKILSETPILVYNFVVEDFHSYFVGNACIFVHNDTCAKGTANPKVKEAAKRGREQHKAMDYGEGVIKEKTLPSGKRMDGYNPESKTIYELKPNNPKAIKSATIRKLS